MVPSDAASNHMVSTCNWSTCVLVRLYAMDDFIFVESLQLSSSIKLDSLFPLQKVVSRTP